MASEKKLIVRNAVLSTLVLLGLCCVLPGYLYSRVYYREHDEVEARLKAIPNVRIIRMWGNEDFTLEDICAEFQVGEHGRLMFFYLDKNSFEDAPRFLLAGVGPWNLDVCNEVEPSNRTVAEREWSWSNSILVGVKGRDPGLFPFELRTVQDFVKHYDEIERIVGSMPRDPAPRELRVTPGGRVLYGVQAKDLMWPLRTTRCVLPSSTPNEPNRNQ